MTTLLATACGARPPRKEPGTPETEDLIPHLASELLQEAGCCHKAQVCVCTCGLPRQLRSTCQTYARFLFFSVPHKPLGVKEQWSAVKPELLSSRQECRRGVKGIGNPLRRGLCCPRWRRPEWQQGRRPAKVSLSKALNPPTFSFHSGR